MRTMKTIATAVILTALAAGVPATASADPDSCRVGADGQYYSNVGQRCRGDDIDQWHVGNSPQLFCWFYSTNPMCKENAR